HVRTAVALEPPRFLIDAAELTFGNVAIVAAQFLLGLELHAVVGELTLAALAVLARPVFTPVHRALWPTPDVLAHPAVDLVFGLHALGHSRPRLSLLLMRIAPSSVPAGPEPTGRASKAQGPAAGRETPGRPQGSPGARVLGASGGPVKPEPDGPGPSRRSRFYLQIQHLMSKLHPSGRAPLAAIWLRCRTDDDIR